MKFTAYTTAAKTANGRHSDPIFDIASIWAKRFSRSSAWLNIAIEGETPARLRVRVTSTARGNITPATENKLLDAGESILNLGNPAYTASIAPDGEGETEEGAEC